MEVQQTVNSTLNSLEDSGYQSTILNKLPEDLIDSDFNKLKNSLSSYLLQATTLADSILRTELAFPETHNLTVLSSKNKLKDVLTHFDRLHSRINDTHSKVLVTGDLNAGKSTFVNALLRRQIVPDDQEPSSAMFVEVIDIIENGGIEEVHAIENPESYSKSDPSTFRRFPITQLREEVENEENVIPLLKVYCTDGRKDSSILQNGVIDVSLIDSPGLNIDSMKTTSLFSKQEEIDVIVFVVNAENHFTLSGKEFLETATKEKAYVFIVVNRFDSIKRKDRNKREILEQIKSISPSTYDDSAHLVHFVSTRKVFQHYVEGVESTEENWISDFEALESSLKNFILNKRAKSKLAPGKVFLKNVLADLEYLSSYNVEQSSSHEKKVSEDLETAGPIYRQLKLVKEEHLKNLDYNINTTKEAIARFTKDTLNSFLNEFDLFMESTEWDGAIHVWRYAHELRTVVTRLANIRLRSTHSFAQEQCIKYIEHIETGLPSNLLNIEIDKSSIISGLEYQNENALLALSDLDLFDSSDKFDIIKDYVPSVSMLGISFLGYRSLVTGILGRQSSPSFGKLAKLLFTGLAVTGIWKFLYTYYPTGFGMLLFNLSDMKSSIQNKVSVKMHQYFKKSKFVNNQVDLISNQSKRLLTVALKDFNKKFNTILDEQESQFNAKTVEQTRVKDQLSSFESFWRRVTGLKSDVEKLVI
ncbi:P-loop containing nucleoside triphosphate hydrolase protein [Globomyces pollinis-pini]|nr:P-loop containing nucleoside triphosphate hydrolase protein [Globomyces pollinis-pini]